MLPGLWFQTDSSQGANVKNHPTFSLTNALSLGHQLQNVNHRTRRVRSLSSYPRVLQVKMSSYNIAYLNSQGFNTTSQSQAEMGPKIVGSGQLETEEGLERLLQGKLE